MVKLSSFFCSVLCTNWLVKFRVSEGKPKTWVELGIDLGQRWIGQEDRCLAVLSAEQHPRRMLDKVGQRQKGKESDLAFQLGLFAVSERLKKGGAPVASIVEYNEEKAAVNGYPERIISPPHPSSCCSSGMEQVGDVEEDGNWLYIYKRCRTCGYTVRHFLMMNAKAIRKMRDDILRGLN